MPHIPLLPSSPLFPSPHKAWAFGQRRQRPPEPLLSPSCFLKTALPFPLLLSVRLASVPLLLLLWKIRLAFFALKAFWVETAAASAGARAGRLAGGGRGGQTPGRLDGCGRTDRWRMEIESGQEKEEEERRLMTPRKKREKGPNFC